jgi:hypothetical protein
LARFLYSPAQPTHFAPLLGAHSKRLSRTLPPAQQPGPAPPSHFKFTSLRPRPIFYHMLCIHLHHSQVPALNTTLLLAVCHSHHSGPSKHVCRFNSAHVIHNTT